MWKGWAEQKLTERVGEKAANSILLSFYANLVEGEMEIQCWDRVEGCGYELWEEEYTGRGYWMKKENGKESIIQEWGWEEA